MIKTAFQSSIGLLPLLLLSACATQETSEPVAEEQTMQCARGETLTCDRFSKETYNCSCEKGDNLRDMLDAYHTPDY